MKSRTDEWIHMTFHIRIRGKICKHIYTKTKVRCVSSHVSTSPRHVMLLLPCIYLQLIHQPTYVLNKTYSEAIIKLLHVSAPGCHYQGVIQNKFVYYSAWHETLHTLYQDEISSDHIRSRQMFVNMRHTECKQLATLPGTAHFKNF